METMNAEETNELKQLVSQICHRMGMNAAHDWDGIETNKDVFLYLNSILEQLPPRKLGGTYQVVCSNGLYLETNDLKRNLEILIERELEIPNRKSDLAALLKIRKIVTSIQGLIDDTEEDIKRWLYVERAVVMQTVLGHVNGLEGIITEGNMTKLITTHPFDEEMVDDINAEIEEKLGDTPMDYVMLPVVAHPGDNNVIYWPWKG